MEAGVFFTQTAWKQYTNFQKSDKKISNKINDLVKDILRNGLLKGLGKPEALKYISACSRRITEEHRLVYNSTKNNMLVIIACEGHYES